MHTTLYSKYNDTYLKTKKIAFVVKVCVKMKDGGYRIAIKVTLAVDWN